MWIIVADFEAEDESTACVESLVGADCQLEVQQIIRILELGFACGRQCQFIYVLKSVKIRLFKAFLLLWSEVVQLKFFSEKSLPFLHPPSFAVLVRITFTWIYTGLLNVEKAIPKILSLIILHFYKDRYNNFRFPLFLKLSIYNEANSNVYFYYGSYIIGGFSVQ